MSAQPIISAVVAEVFSVYEDEADALEVETASLNERLEWHLARIGRRRSEIADRKAEAARMIEKYTLWQEQVTKQPGESLAWHEECVRQLVLRHLDEHPKAAKTMHLPSGVVSTRAGSQVVEVEDLAALVDWSSVHNTALVEYKPQPVKAAIREAVANGEAVPGVQVVQRDRSVTVTTDLEPGR